MARILSSLIGDLRGSIGGQTYSRNKAGAFIRQRVKPVNPQTTQQQNARYRFGNMSILYQSLSSAQKDCWQVFASTHFNPLKGNNSGIYSGGNAFVGIRQSAGQGNARKEIAIGTQGINAVTFDSVSYSEVVEPPSTPLSATMKDDTGTAREFTISAVQIDNAGKLQFNLSFPTGAEAPTNQITSFRDAENTAFGLSFYMSNNLKFPGGKPNTALKINPWDTGIINTIEVDGGPNGIVIGQTTIIELQSNVLAVDTRDFPCASDHVLVTAFARSQAGAQKLLSTHSVTLTEA